MLTGGRHVAPVAMLHLGQSYHVGANRRPEELTSALQDVQFDCDWLLYDAWEQDATLDGKGIKLHQEDYQVLVMPAAEVIPYPTLAKAREFFDKGGVVLAYGMLPGKSATLGRGSKDIAQLRDALWGAAKPGLTVCKTSAAGGRAYFLPETPTPADLRKVLSGDAGIHPALEVLAGDTGNWLHVLHRQKAGRDVFLVCNQNHQGPARTFTFRAATMETPEIWDPMRNEITSIPSQRQNNHTEFALTLEPSESVLVVFQGQQRKLPGRITAGMKPQREIPLRDTRTVTDPSRTVVPGPNTSAPPQDVLRNAAGRHVNTSPVQANPFDGSCVIPADLDLTKSRVYLEVDELAPEAAASVTVNGRFAGGFIGKPLRLEVTRLLRTGSNTIHLDPFAPNSARLVVY